MKTEQDFWQLIANARQTMDESPIDESVINQLTEWDNEDIIRYQAIFYELLVRSHRWDLIAAGTVMNGSCTDDGFEYFKCWLIAQGKEVYYGVLEHPDSLADYIKSFSDSKNIHEDFYELEEMLYIALTAYMEKNNIQDSEVADEALGTNRTAEFEEMQGQEWEYKDLPTMLPKLCALFQYEYQEEE